MSEKGKVILAYLLGWIGGLVVLFGMNDSTRDTRFHAAQSICLSGGYFIITVIYNMLPIYIPFLSTALSIVYLLGIIFGIIKSNNNENPELPVLGGLTKSLFGKVIGEEDVINTNVNSEPSSNTESNSDSNSNTDAQ